MACVIQLVIAQHPFKFGHDLFVIGIHDVALAGFISLATVFQGYYRNRWFVGRRAYLHGLFRYKFHAFANALISNDLQRTECYGFGTAWQENINNWLIILNFIKHLIKQAVLRFRNSRLDKDGIAAERQLVRQDVGGTHEVWFPRLCFKTIGVHLFPEGLPADPEHLGCPGLVPARDSKNADDVLLLCSGCNFRQRHRSIAL